MRVILDGTDIEDLPSQAAVAQYALSGERPSDGVRTVPRMNGSGKVIAFYEVRWDKDSITVRKER